MPYDTTLAPQPTAPPPIPDAVSQPIAHWTHTLALFLVVIVTASLGRLRAAAAIDNSTHLLRYLSSIMIEWLLLGAVIAGIYRRRKFFLTAFANRARSIATSLGLGLAVYCVGFITIATIGSALYFTPLFHRRNEAVILAMMPHTPFEFIAWFFVSLTAGICEELIFRGYLLQQLTAWTQRPIVAILAVGALFGCIHLYEGAAAIVPLAALGIVYGFIVRHYKGDLRAVIVAHTLQDFLVALLFLARPFLERYRHLS
jgi:membrane protease YdiL (CAAX protease family)